MLITARLEKRETKAEICRRRGMEKGELVSNPSQPEGELLSTGGTGIPAPRDES
jgi:hypothetical protein